MEKEKPLLWDNNLYDNIWSNLDTVMGVSSITPAFPQVVEVFGISPRESLPSYNLFNPARDYIRSLFGI
jgi:hypothetical protein